MHDTAASAAVSRRRRSVGAALVGLSVATLVSGCGIFGGRERPEVRQRPPLSSRSTTVVTVPAPVATPAPVPPAVREPHAAEAQVDPDDPVALDAFGFSGDEYLALVTPQEMDVLRLRARGDPAAHLSRFLTAKEKENLRRRSAELTEIGAEPLRIGE